MSSPASLPFETETLSKLADVLTACPLDGAMLPELRETLAGRLGQLELADLALYPMSLTQDVRDHTCYYLAAERTSNGYSKRWEQSVMLAIFAGSAPRSPSFPLKGEENGVEIEASPWTLWSLPFRPSDFENLEYFAREIAPEFLPRAAGLRAVIDCEIQHPEFSLPAVFAAAQSWRHGRADGPYQPPAICLSAEWIDEPSLAARDGEEPMAPGHGRLSMERLYHTAIWAAVRAGYRGGYALSAVGLKDAQEESRDRDAPASPSADTFSAAARCNRFRIDISDLIDLRADPRQADHYSDEEVDRIFQRRFSSADQNWIYEQFEEPYHVAERVYAFSPGQTRRLAVQFGRGLQAAERLFNGILGAKSKQGLAPGCDLELDIESSEFAVSAEDLLFLAHWAKGCGCAAALVAARWGFLREETEFVRSGDGDAEFHALAGATAREFAAIASYAGTTLGVSARTGVQEPALAILCREARGQLSLRIGNELQMQLLDVLAEQEPGSTWRELFDRMVARTEGFAAREAYGTESEMAARGRTEGAAVPLGDWASGRAGANRFLIRWLGNTVGSRDLHAPNGDHRFFSEKLQELPEPLVREVQRRNRESIERIASRLRGE